MGVITGYTYTVSHAGDEYDYNTLQMAQAKAYDLSAEDHCPVTIFAKLNGRALNTYTYSA